MHDRVSIPSWVPFPQYSGLPSMVYLHEFSFPESICLPFGIFWLPCLPWITFSRATILLAFRIVLSLVKTEQWAEGGTDLELHPVTMISDVETLLFIVLDVKQNQSWDLMAFSVLFRIKKRSAKADDLDLQFPLVVVFVALHFFFFLKKRFCGTLFKLELTCKQYGFELGSSTYMQMVSDKYCSELWI